MKPIYRCHGLYPSGTDAPTMTCITGNRYHNRCRLFDSVGLLLPGYRAVQRVTIRRCSSAGAAPGIASFSGRIQGVESPPSDHATVPSAHSVRIAAAGALFQRFLRGSLLRRTLNSRSGVPRHRHQQPGSPVTRARTECCITQIGFQYCRRNKSRNSGAALTLQRNIQQIGMI